MPEAKVKRPPFQGPPTPTAMANLFARQTSVMQMNQVAKNLFNSTPTTTLGHLAALDIDGHVEVRTHLAARKTSIICTLGPKTSTPEMVVKLRMAGMNIARLNFSHGTFEYHKGVIDNVRKSFELQPGRAIAIALDTKGPEIRTGNMEEGSPEVTLQAGTEVYITVDDQYKNQCNASRVYVDYKNLPKVVKVGSDIYIDDGLICLKVLEVQPDGVKTRVVNSGKLSSHKGVNLPNVPVDLPAVSDLDVAALKFGVKEGVDIVFASFIRKASDVHAIRQILGPEGQHIKVISKIENQEGVRNFDKILAVSDGIMVARGDLGIEIPSEKVFIAQKMMISRCNIAGKPVICATQMLESMTTNPRPTRAEVSDVANAVLDGADCVMLSGETAKGMYPIETVQMMHRICIEAEQSFFTTAHFNEVRILTTPENITETLACSAVSAAIEQDVGAIIVLTSSGLTARMVSKYRPRCPIITVTRSASVCRQCHLYRGCYPLLFEVAEQKEDWQEEVDSRINLGMEEGKRMGLLVSGSLAIAIQGWRSGGGHTNTMRMLAVP